MKKWLFNVILVPSLIGVITLPVFHETGMAKNQPAKEIILFNNEKIPTPVLSLLENKYPQVKKTLLPEIGLLKLDTENQAAIEEIKQSFPENIELLGRESTLTIPKNHELNPDSVKLAPNALSSGQIEDALLYQIIGWDMKKITEDGQSYLKETGNHGVKVALIDSGIDFNHPDLKENIISKGKSFVPNVADTQDRMGHGTMTAGTIGANGLMLGVGPDLGIIPYKVMDSWEEGAESTWVTAAIIQAAKDGVDVINVSLGTYKSLKNPEDRAIVESFQRAVKFAHKKGAIVVASAGNENTDLKEAFTQDKNVHLPGGGSSFILNVSATDKDNKLASYSNYGRITVAAPGGDYGAYWETEQLLDPLAMTLTTYPTDLPQPYLSQLLGLPPGYVFTMGTSVAAPKVSGAVGILIAEQREKGIKPLSFNDINYILKKSSLDIGEKGQDSYFGYGLININKALDEIK